MYNRFKFSRIGVMLDCSRNGVMNLPTLKRWIDLIKDFGYNTLLLYLEDTYEIESRPYFGHLRGKYTQNELKEVDDYAFSKGIEVIPCIQTLAHIDTIFQWSEYKKICDCNDILLVGEEETYLLIDDMLKTLSKTFRSRCVNIGMDEAHMLGRGKYLDKNGHRKNSDLMLEHLSRISGLAKNYNFELTMWGDMFFRFLNNGKYYGKNTDVPKEIKDRIPDNVNLVYWDYYSLEKEHYDREIKAHKGVKDGIWFAGSLVSWNDFVPDNTFSIKACRSAISACAENGVSDIFFTIWGDDGAECSPFSLLPSLYFAACFAKGITDQNIIKKGFKENTGIDFDSYMLLDLPNTPNDDEPFIEFETYVADKYLFYNDCFLGKYDDTIREGDAAAYKLAAERLATVNTTPEYGYIFETISLLCKVLSIKTDIGMRTRKAYLKGNINALEQIVTDYSEMIKLTEKFYDSFCYRWMYENKPQGFEVQDVRIGGLIQRMKHCRKRLTAYLRGELSKIEELEEQVLSHNGTDASLTHEKATRDSFNWASVVTSNRL